jgi:hypothetical protein
MLVVALADTPTLWKYGGPDGASNAPLLVARWVALPGAPPFPGIEQAQTLGGPMLAAGTPQARFWSGNVSSKGGLCLGGCIAGAGTSSSMCHGVLCAVHTMQHVS